MTKKDVLKAEKEKSKPALVCQMCKHHSNKPSRCLEGKVVRYVGRKNPACINFKR